MRAKREYRDRGDTAVAVLDTLVDRGREGMTVFELRSEVEADIDAIEGALEELHDDGLIEAQRDGERTRFQPKERVIPEVTEEGDETEGIVDRLRDRLPL
ncbi:MarR family transcriptional regulator [Halobacteriales archaeon SW_7_68_16]|nr:MAG: MarR family transcriptional regulator [Halobacteriales archaeon SW_7_68_16]